MDTSKLQHWSAEHELESACSALCKAEVTTAYKYKLILASQRPRHAPQGRQLDNLLCKQWPQPRLLRVVLRLHTTETTLPIYFQSILFYFPLSFPRHLSNRPQNRSIWSYSYQRDIIFLPQKSCYIVVLTEFVLSLQTGRWVLCNPCTMFNLMTVHFYLTCRYVKLLEYSDTCSWMLKTEHIKQTVLPRVSQIEHPNARLRLGSQ